MAPTSSITPHTTGPEKQSDLPAIAIAEGSTAAVCTRESLNIQSENQKKTPVSTRTVHNMQKTPFYEIHFQSPRLSARISTLDGIAFKNSPLILVPDENGDLIDFNSINSPINKEAAVEDNLESELENDNQIEVVNHNEIKISKQTDSVSKNPFRRLTRSSHKKNTKTR
jgi:hypothetical protein